MYVCKMHESMSAEKKGSPSSRLHKPRMKGNKTVELVTPAPVNTAVGESEALKDFARGHGAVGGWGALISGC